MVTGRPALHLSPLDLSRNASLLVLAYSPSNGIITIFRLMLSLDYIEDYITQIKICQVLFLEISLAPIMCTNLTISFWMQPIILITVMFIDQINKQTIYKCNQRCNSKYCPKDNLNYCRLHLTSSFALLIGLYHIKFNLSTLNFTFYSIFYAELYFYMIRQY